MTSSNISEDVIVIINFEDDTLDCKFLCSFCGLKFNNNNSFQLHLHAVHLSPIYQNLEIQDIFREAARKLNYPSWLKLPSLIETEIQHLLPNYLSNKQESLYKISILFQRNLENYLKTWKNNEKVS